MKTMQDIYRLAIEVYADSAYNAYKIETYYGLNNALVLKRVTALHMCAIATTMILKGEY